MSSGLDSNRPRMAMDSLSSNSPGSRSGAKVGASLKDVLEIDGNGAYCRMPGCRFAQRTYRSSHFYEHFRREHPDEARRRGLFKSMEQLGSDAVFRPDLPLKQIVLEYVSMDSDGIHCQLTEDDPKCTYVQQKFNYQNFARHFCKMHPTEANLKGFRRGFLGRVLEKKALKASYRATILEHATPKRPRAVLDYVVREKDGRWCCRIAGPSCPFAQKVFVSEKFRRHFRLKHPREAKECGFLEEVVQEKMEYLAESTPSADPSTYCRLCFSTSASSLVPIFNHPDQHINLPNLIESCTNIHLSPDEDRHSSICEACCQKLHEIQSFRRQCQRLDGIVVRGRRATPIENALVDVPSVEFLVEMIKPEPVDEMELSSETKKNEEKSFAMVTLNEVPYYKCCDCDTLMRLRSNVWRHWQRYHRNGKRQARKVHCSVAGCGKFFMERKAQKNHLELCHRFGMKDSQAN